MAGQFEKERLEHEAIVKPYTDLIDKLKKEKEECGVLIRKLYAEIDQLKGTKKDIGLSDWLSKFSVEDGPKGVPAVKKSIVEQACEPPRDPNRPGPKSIHPNRSGLKTKDDYDVIAHTHAKVLDRDVTIQSLKNDIEMLNTRRDESRKLNEDKQLIINSLLKEAKGKSVLNECVIKQSEMFEDLIEVGKNCPCGCCSVRRKFIAMLLETK